MKSSQVLISPGKSLELIGFRMLDLFSHIYVFFKMFQFIFLIPLWLNTVFPIDILFLMLPLYVCRYVLPELEDSLGRSRVCIRSTLPRSHLWISLVCYCFG